MNCYWRLHIHGLMHLQVLLSEVSGNKSETSFVIALQSWGSTEQRYHLAAISICRVEWSTMFWLLWVSGCISKISIASFGACQGVRRIGLWGHKRRNNLAILCELILELDSLCFGTLSLRGLLLCYSHGAIFKQLHRWNRILSDINNPTVLCWNTAWAVLV